ncbi:hypothetical protein Tco_0332181 [Tanacetum coccineum]
MMRVARSFLKGEVAASNHEWKKMFPPWKQHEGLDEFRGCKITISVQWDYWKTMSQKITSGSVDSSPNAKDPGRRRVITLKSSKFVPLECAMVFGPKGIPSVTKPIMEERIKVAINPEYLKQTKLADMIGVPRQITEHRLNVRDGCSPGRQKKKGQAADRNQAIQEEIRKLVEAGIMKEVHYHDWLSNPMMVRKHDDIWRMCVDFKDLNKACPKDGYPLPEID